MRGKRCPLLVGGAVCLIALPNIVRAAGAEKFGADGAGNGLIVMTLPPEQPQPQSLLAGLVPGPGPVPAGEPELAGTPFRANVELEPNIPLLFQNSKKASASAAPNQYARESIRLIPLSMSYREKQKDTWQRSKPTQLAVSLSTCSPLTILYHQASIRATFRQ